MNIAILVAAGMSQRFSEHGTYRDKAFELINGEPIIMHSLKMLSECKDVDEIYVAVNGKNRRAIVALVKKGDFKKVKKIFLGGSTRFESATKILPIGRVAARLNYCRAQRARPLVFGDVSLHGRRLRGGNIIIHNVANPLAGADEISLCLRALKPGISGAAVGRKIHSTVKRANSLEWHAPVEVSATVPRQNLWEVETPQVVRAEDFLRACRGLRAQEFDYTDDLSVLEAAGMKTVIVEAAYKNRKLTRPEDLEILRFFAGEGRGEKQRAKNADYVVGIGEDSHEFDGKGKMENGKGVHKKILVLGGVKIPGFPPLKAESDGDVILHALCNALASALGMGSLGTYATKMRERGMLDSSKYLKKITEQISRRHRKINSCAISIEAARPLIDPLAPKIKKSLSKLLKIPSTKIGITATSGEALTPFGKGRAIKCQATVLLR